MPNFKLLIEYKGTNYAGWQRQKRLKTVQGEIEKALKKIFGKALKLIGAGRTDTGVHALGQVANFSVDTKLSKGEIIKALNFHLPKDIRVKKIDCAASHFHSRFSAKSKIYRYLIGQNYSPFLKDMVYFYRWELDLDRMSQAAKYLLGRHNFSSFQNRGSNRKSAVTAVKGIIIKKTYLNPKQRVIMVEVEATAFLYRMVRNMVGLFLEVGRGKIAPKETKSILEKQNRRFAPLAVPGYGLYLYKLKY